MGGKTKRERERQRDRSTERERERDNREGQRGDEACVQQGPLAEPKGWAGQGRAGRRRETMTRDPGCVQTRCQGDLPERTREGSQGRSPAGLEHSRPPRLAHCHPPAAQALAGQGLAQPQQRTQGLFMPTETGILGAEDVWAVRASDKEAFWSNHRGIFT